jgi:hypothetical protein
MRGPERPPCAEHVADLREEHVDLEKGTRNLLRAEVISTKILGKKSDGTLESPKEARLL